MVRNGSTTHTCMTSSFNSASVTKSFSLILRQEMVDLVHRVVNVGNNEKQMTFWFYTIIITSTILPLNNYVIFLHKVDSGG